MRALALVGVLLAAASDGALGYRVAAPPTTIMMGHQQQGHQRQVASSGSSRR